MKFYVLTGNAATPAKPNMDKMPINNDPVFRYENNFSSFS